MWPVGGCQQLASATSSSSSENHPWLVQLTALTDSETYTQKITVTVPAGAHTTIHYTYPVIRYYGTWVVSYGNTVVNLQNFYTDYPDPNGNGAYLLDQVPAAT